MFKNVTPNCFLIFEVLRLFSTALEEIEATQNEIFDYFSKESPLDSGLFSDVEIEEVIQKLVVAKFGSEKEWVRSIFGLLSAEQCGKQSHD